MSVLIWNPYPYHNIYGTIGLASAISREWEQQWYVCIDNYYDRLKLWRLYVNMFSVRKWQIRLRLRIWRFWYKKYGAVSIWRCRLTSIGIPMLKMRQSHDRLIFSMGIPIPGKERWEYSQQDIVDIPTCRWAASGTKTSDVYLVSIYVYRQLAWKCQCMIEQLSDSSQVLHHSFTYFRRLNCWHVRGRIWGRCIRPIWSDKSIYFPEAFQSPRRQWLPRPILLKFHLRKQNIKYITFISRNYTIHGSESPTRSVNNINMN